MHTNLWLKKADQWLPEARGSESGKGRNFTGVQRNFEGDIYVHI